MKSDLEILINEICQYRTDETILLTLELLRKFDFEQKMAPQWYYLTLIQFSAIFSSSSKLLLTPRMSDLNALCKRIEKIQSDYVLDHFGFKSTNLSKTMRILKHQQFWQFDNSPEYDITKQFFLFDNQKIKNIFFTKFGFTIGDFLDLAVFTFLYTHNISLSKFNGFIDEKYLACITHMKSDVIANKFLGALSIKDTEDLKEQFEKFSNVKNGIYKMFEFGFTIKKPLIYIHRNYRIYNRQLLYHSFKYFIYDSLKGETGFGDYFGPAFENYVELGLKEKKLNYITDNQIKKLTKGSNTDYLIEKRILVECKATELIPRSAVNPTDESLSQALKSSIIKGYKQIIQTANLLNLTDCIGIIVTYKDLKLEGEDAFEEILQNRNNWFTEEEIKVMKNEKFFILDIDKWDKLISCVDSNLEDLISQITQEKIKGIKQFEDYLTDLGKEEKPFNFLAEKYKEFIKK